MFFMFFDFFDNYERALTLIYFATRMIYLS